MLRGHRGCKQPRIDVFPQASILLVDDDLKGREAIASIVQELGHRVVAAAATIRDASAFAMIAEFDLAILNTSIDGNRIDPVAHLLQRRQRPILFITCSGTRWLPSLFRGHSVLQKPISIEELKETIEAIIDPEATVS
jgi:DNA-binding response OmpR family regulator